MPRFAANLSMMFTEVPLLNASPQREAGFDAVEFLFPYDYSPANPAATGAKPPDAGAVQYRSRRY